MTRLTGLVRALMLVCLCLAPVSALADATIIIDGADTGDWPTDSFYYRDADGDMPPPWGDIESVMVTNDNTVDSDGFLYIGVDFYNDFREKIGSNDVDLVIYLDTDLDGQPDFAIELTEGTVTNLNTSAVNSIAAMDYQDDFVEASIPYSVLGLEHGADTFALYVAVEGKPDGTIERSPEPGEASDGFIIYDGTVGDGVEPLAVRMRDLGAHLDRDGVTVAWSTGLERGNLGFFVYRQRGDAPPQQLTLRAIPGLGHAPMGRDYRFLDPSGREDDLYFLEDVDSQGRSKLHGPLFPDRSAPLALYAPRPSRTPAMTPRSVRKRHPDAGRANKYAVRQSGLQRLAGVGPRTAVEAEGLLLPVLGQGADLLFYAEATVDRYADFTPLFTIPGRPAPRMKATQVRGDCPAPITALREHREIESDQNYFISPQEGDAFLWTWSFAGAAAVMPFAAAHPVADADPIALSIRLLGLSASHSVRVRLNGTDLGVRAWTDGGMKLAHLDFEAPAGALAGGDNVLTVEPAAASDMDILYLDGFSLEYTRSLVADGGSLRFVAPADSCLQVAGLAADPAPFLLDTTDPTDPRVLRGFAFESEEAGARLRFATPAGATKGPRTYLLTTAAAAGSPEFLGPSQSRALADPALAADYLVISHPDFAEAAQALMDHHRARGLRPLLVTTTEVFDTFAHGRPGPAGIRTLLDTARSTWQQAPRYVLLFGGATVDPNGYTYRQQTDFVPTPFVLTRDAGYEAAADGTYVADPGQAPWAAIGRLAVNTPEEAKAVVAKLLAAYARFDAPTGRLLFVADSTAAGLEGTPSDFAHVQDELIASCVAPDAQPLTVYKDLAAYPTEDILAQAQAGLDALIYFGHGFMGGWSYAPTLMDGAAAGQMVNDRPFLLVSGSCFDGAFPGPWVAPLAWEMVRNPEGGAWAATASSMTVNPAAVAFVAEQVLCRLSAGAEPTLGDALRATKADLAGAGSELQEALDTYHLLGDPAAPNPFLN